MSHSILLKLARDSIQEVIEAKNIIDKNRLLKEHPLLNEKISIVINLYINEKLQSSYVSKSTETPLINKIIIGAKKVVFEDIKRGTLLTSQYLNCELEIILYTSNGELRKKDKAIIQI